MKVKDLIKHLSSMDQESEIVSGEYNGSCHAIHKAQTVIEYRVGEKIKNWDGESSTSSVSDKGICKKSVVYIN